MSPPSRGAWIEIGTIIYIMVFVNRRPPRGGRGLKYWWCYWYLWPSASPPSRGAWIEIFYRLFAHVPFRSPPSRGAWIEIPLVLGIALVVVVAPLAGGVD